MALTASYCGSGHHDVSSPTRNQSAGPHARGAATESSGGSSGAADVGAVLWRRQAQAAQGGAETISADCLWSRQVRKVSSCWPPNTDSTQREPDRPTNHTFTIHTTHTNTPHTTHHCRSPLRGGKSHNAGPKNRARIRRLSEPGYIVNNKVAKTIKGMLSGAAV